MLLLPPDRQREVYAGATINIGAWSQSKSMFQLLLLNQYVCFFQKLESLKITKSKIGKCFQSPWEAVCSKDLVLYLVHKKWLHRLKIFG